MPATYKFEKEYLSLVEEPQLRLFENDFQPTTDKFLAIKFDERGYKANGK